MQQTQSTKAGERTQHTPGPWTNDEQGDHIVAFAVNGTMLNECNSIAVVYGPDAKANARLIAAAPELFRALVATWIIIEADESFLEHIGHCLSKETGKTLHETVRAAIAKAEGREE